jgi:hypothetical protein
MNRNSSSLDIARSDCWPDWSAAGDDAAVRAGVNAPGRVLFEAGLVVGIPLALAAIATLLAPVL